MRRAAALGMATLAVLMRVDYRRYNSYAVVVSAVAATTLLLVGVFAMHDSHATHRWMRLGAFSLQPSELAKPVLVLFLFSQRALVSGMLAGATKG